MKNKFRFAIRTIVACGLVLGTGGPVARAADRTWANSATNFNDGNSWTLGVAPGAGDRAVFATAAGATTQPQLTASLSIANLYFSTATSSGYDLTSSSAAFALTLTATGTGTSSAIDSVITSGTNTIDALLMLGGAAGTTQQFVQSAGGTLTINGAISGGDSTSTLTLNASGSNGLIRLTGSSSFTSNIGLSGSGSVVSVTDIGNANTNSSLGAGTTITFNAGMTLRYTGAGQNASKVISINNTTGATIDTNTATGALVLTANLLAPGGGAKTLTLSGGTTNSEFSGNIVDGTGGGTTAVNIRNGLWILSGTNTFTGGVSLSSGSLGIKSASALGTGTFTPGNVAFDNVSGGALTLTTNNPISLAGSAPIFTGTNDLNLGTGAVTLSANVGLTVGGSKLTIGGAIGDGAANKSFTVAGGGTLISNGNNTYTGLTRVNAATLTLAGDNTAATGGLQVGDAAAVLNINSPTAIGTGTLNITSAGTLDNTSGAAITLTTNNTITLGNNFAFTGTSSLNLGTGTATTTSVRTITVNGNTLTFGGVITGTGGGITKQGTGTLALSGANTYTGKTTVAAGILLANGTGTGAVSSATGTNTVAVNGGTLGGTGRVLGAVTVSAGATLLGGDGSTTTFGMLTLAVNPTLNSGGASNIGLTLGAGNAHSSLAFASNNFNGFSTTQNFVLGNLQTGNYDNIITGLTSGVATGGWTITGLATGNYMFSEDASNNIDLVITTVPEPGTWAMGLLAALTGGCVLRRRMAAC